MKALETAIFRLLQANGKVKYYFKKLKYAKKNRESIVNTDNQNIDFI